MNLRRSESAPVLTSVRGSCSESTYNSDDEEGETWEQRHPLARFSLSSNGDPLYTSDDRKGRVINEQESPVADSSESSDEEDYTIRTYRHGEDLGSEWDDVSTSAFKSATDEGTDYSTQDEEEEPRSVELDCEGGKLEQGRLTHDEGQGEDKEISEDQLKTNDEGCAKHLGNSPSSRVKEPSDSGLHLPKSLIDQSELQRSFARFDAARFGRAIRAEVESLDKDVSSDRREDKVRHALTKCPTTF